MTHEDFSGSKKYEGFDIQANIDLTPKDADGNKQQQPDQTSQPKTTAEGTYQLDDTRQEVRATVGPGEIIIRDKDKQAELEASGQTEDLAALNRDPDKAYEITKDKHVEIEYYLSDTSVKAAFEVGAEVTQVLGQVLDRMLANGDLSPQERADARKLEPYMNDPKVIAGLRDCTGHAWSNFSPFSWIVPSAHANAATCTAVASDGAVITVLKSAALNCLDILKEAGKTAATVSANTALRAALGTAGFYFYMTNEAGGAKVGETFTAVDGSTVNVTGRGDSYSRTVTITTAAGSTIVLNLQPGANGQLVLENGTINGQSMNNGMLQDAAATLQSGGITNVVLSQGNSGNSTSKGGATSGSSGAAAGAPDPDDNDPFKRPNDNLQKGDRVNLNQFEQRVKVDGEVRYQDPKSGYQIVKDRAGSNSHGGSAWKLLDRTGKRIGTLNSNGTFLRK
ncbi:hypothetical protein [Brucella pituitosa]|uniref:Uncharacterized protein n=1 Tax=Brucella pituitosa TaxID=571256 RepID=A0A643EZA3_9HYPH|nr:hypothetical protein [Brucella pituitosa]KAB0571054.1 hypothetical protein F7Q93_13885 [Brucella pituitosa]